MSEQIQVKQVSTVKVHQPAGGVSHKRQSARSQIYVRAVKGPIETFPRLFGFIFLGLFAVIPWIRYDGHQAILLDIMEQRFTGSRRINPGR